MSNNQRIRILIAMKDMERCLFDPKRQGELCTEALTSLRSEIELALVANNKRKIVVLSSA